MLVKPLQQNTYQQINQQKQYDDSFLPNLHPHSPLNIVKKARSEINNKKLTPKLTQKGKSLRPNPRRVQSAKNAIKINCQNQFNQSQNQNSQNHSNNNWPEFYDKSYSQSFKEQNSINILKNQANLDSQEIPKEKQKYQNNKNNMNVQQENYQLNKNLSSHKYQKLRPITAITTFNNARTGYISPYEYNQSNNNNINSEETSQYSNIKNSNKQHYELTKKELQLQKKKLDENFERKKKMAQNKSNLFKIKSNSSQFSSLLLNNSNSSLQNSQSSLNKILNGNIQNQQIIKKNNTSSNNQIQNNESDSDQTYSNNNQNKQQQLYHYSSYKVHQKQQHDQINKKQNIKNNTTNKEGQQYTQQIQEKNSKNTSNNNSNNSTQNLNLNSTFKNSMNKSYNGKKVFNVNNNFNINNNTNTNKNNSEFSQSSQSLRKQFSIRKISNTFKAETSSSPQKKIYSENIQQDKNTQNLNQSNINQKNQVPIKNQQKQLQQQQQQQQKLNNSNKQNQCLTQLTQSNQNFQQINVKVSDILLGEGTYGQVYQGLVKDTGKFIAVKQINIAEFPGVEEDITSEIQMLQNLQHPNIVRYLGSKIEKDNLFIYLEQMTSGSLMGMLKEYGKFQENIIKKYTQQLLQGLNYLHSYGVVHRDLKCANILCDSAGNIKLTDFGSAQYLNKFIRPGKEFGVNNDSQMQIASNYSFMSKNQVQNNNNANSNLDSSLDKILEEQKEEKEQKNFNNMKGSLYWMAPEVFQ